MARPKIEYEKELLVNLVPDCLWKCLKRITDEPLDLPENLSSAEKIYIEKFQSDWDKIARWIMAEANPIIHTGFSPYNRPDFVHAKYEAKFFYH